MQSPENKKPEINCQNRNISSSSRSRKQELIDGCNKITEQSVLLFSLFGPIKIDK